MSRKCGHFGHPTLKLEVFFSGVAGVTRPRVKKWASLLDFPESWSPLLFPLRAYTGCNSVPRLRQFQPHAERDGHEKPGGDQQRDHSTAALVSAIRSRHWVVT